MNKEATITSGAQDVSAAQDTINSSAKDGKQEAKGINAKDAKKTDAKGEPKGAARRSKKIYFLRLSAQDQILFAKRLGLLIKAGVPIVEALRMIEKQAGSHSASHIFGAVASAVENGQFLATGMAKFGKLFGPFAINIVEIGEISGTLYENLNYLAEELKKKQELRRKIISSMVYPIFIVLATFGIAGLLTAYVFPKILPIFQGLNFQLPWTTRMLIFISNILINYWPFILLGIAALTVGWIFLMRSAKFHHWFDRQLLRIPLVGKITQSYNMANLSRTLGLLLKSDVRIVRAATITADTTNNLAYRRALQNLAESVSKGEKVSANLESYGKLFPSMMTQMITVGERTGNLSGTLVFLAEIYENEVDNLTKNLSTLLEPVLMVFMGLLVGFIAVSIITPIYGVTQNLHP